MKKPSILVIDDDPKEIQRIRTHLRDSFTIGGGQNLEEARSSLEEQGGKRPRLALVDMYFPDRQPTDTDRLALHAARGRYLKAQAIYLGALAKLGQSPQHGFEVAKDIRMQWPKLGVAFFTRKGTLEDAIRAYEDVRVAGVIKKPDPPVEVVDSEHPETLDIAYDQQFAHMKGILADKIRQAIRRSSFWGRWGREIRGAVVALVLAILAAVAVEIAKRGVQAAPANPPMQPTGSARG
jgi:CheY-like chemotaxis protein